MRFAIGNQAVVSVSIIFFFYINICINQSFILFLMLSFDVLLFTETTVEVLPRLCQIKYASGTLEELLYIDMPHESQNPSGQIILDYTKAIQESVFDQLRVVREGHLRIVFNPDLKVILFNFPTFPITLFFDTFWAKTQICLLFFFSRLHLGSSVLCVMRNLFHGGL